MNLQMNWLYVNGLMLALTACAPSPSDTAIASRDSGPPALAERPKTGQWFAGDLHVHATGASNDTGGDSFPNAIQEMAILRGLSFVVLTDHSNSTGSDPSTTEEDPELFNMGPEFPYLDQVKALSSAEFLMLDGNELSPVSEDMSGPTGHIGCIPRPGPGFDASVAFIDRPRGSVTGAGRSWNRHDTPGASTILNHPYALAPWIAYDWTSTGYDAVEVWNGGLQFDRYDYEGLKAWACDLAQGRSPTLVGGSDNHRVNIEPPGEPADPALGVPSTWLWTSSLTQDALVDALDRGRTSVSDTPGPLELDIFNERGRLVGHARR